MSAIQAGWESTATTSMIAELVNGGVRWDRIRDTLAHHGAADEDIFKNIVGYYQDQGAQLKGFATHAPRIRRARELLRTIQATVDPVVANPGTFNNFQMDADPQSFNRFRMHYDGPYSP